MVLRWFRPLRVPEAYYAKLLVLPWNQSWDYSFESLPMLTTFEDLSGSTTSPSCLLYVDT